MYSYGPSSLKAYWYALLYVLFKAMCADSQSQKLETNWLANQLIFQYQRIATILTS